MDRALPVLVTARLRLEPAPERHLDTLWTIWRSPDVRPSSRLTWCAPSGPSRARAGHERIDEIISVCSDR